MPGVAVGVGERGWKDGGYSKQHVQKCAHCADANTNAIKHSINESSRLRREGGAGAGAGEANKVCCCSTGNSSPRRLLSAVATEAEITQ